MRISQLLGLVKRYWAVSWLGLLALASLLSLRPNLQHAASILDLEHLAEPPSTQHWLGTDPFGRDVFVDLLAGTRSLLVLSTPAALLTSLLGVALGGAAGYWGNSALRVRRSVAFVLITALIAAMLAPAAWLPWWSAAAVVGIVVAARRRQPKTISVPLDSIIQVGAAALGAVPRLVLVLALAALQPASPIWLLLILAFTCWTSTARLVRASVLQVRLASYVEAAKALGLSDWQIISRYILPNTWPALRAALPLSLATCISLQTTLAFLGIGLPPDWADWGRTIANARLTPAAWWLMAGAAVPLAVTIIALRSLFDMRKTAVLP